MRAEAAYYLGRLFFYGQGTAIDYKRAAACFEEVVKYTDNTEFLIWSWRYLGDIFLKVPYADNDYVSRLISQKVAFDTISKAANQTDLLAAQAEAQCILAKYYFDGTGVVKNHKKVLELFQIADQTPHSPWAQAEAWVSLGGFYMRGLVIVEKDVARARKYLEQAAAQ